MPVLGQATCVPVGPTSCAEGFEPDASGWGCSAQVADACTGATRETLGSTTCAPVGDCDRAFPPPGAITVGRPGGYARIADAVAAAPAGATIAVDEGTYRESVVLRRPVKIVGRCAAKVTLLGDGQRFGFDISAAGVELSGMTLRGHHSALTVLGTIRGEDLVIDGNLMAGVDVFGARASATLTRVVVRRTAALSRTMSGGVLVSGGATLEIVDSSLAGNESANLLLAEAGSTAKVSRSVIRDGAPDEAGIGGYGVLLLESAAADLSASLLLANRRAGVMQFRGSQVTAVDVIAEGTRPAARSLGSAAGLTGTGFSVVDAHLDATRIAAVRTEGVGIVLSDGGTATITESLFRDGQPMFEEGDMGIGAYVFAGSTLDATSTAFVQNRRAAVEVRDAASSASFDTCLLAATRSMGDGSSGLGLYAQDSVVEMRRSSVLDNLHTGIYLSDAARFSAEGLLVRRTALQETPRILGHGLLVQRTPDVTVRGSRIAESEGIGLVFSSATATVFDSTVLDNTVGIHAQDGAVLVEAAEQPAEASVEANTVVIGTDVRFIGNGTRVGGDALPLPPPLPPIRY